MINLNEFLTGIGFFAKYPYTDFHELNLDWCLAQVAKLRVEFDDFAHVNSLKYAGEWDITKAYSAFSVVDDQGFGYMALKPVPPGTQINDTEYWLMVVDYSQITQDYENRISALETTVGDASSGLVKDVDDLQNDMTTAQNDITALQGTVGDASSGLVKDVDDLQTDMSNAQGDISALQGTVGDASSGLVKDVDDLQNDMTTAQNDIVNLQNGLAAVPAMITAGKNKMRVIIIADSYGVVVDNYGSTFRDLVKTSLGLSNDDFFSTASGGCAFYNPGYPNNTFEGILRSLENIVTDHDTITDIMVVGGANDIERTPSDTVQAINLFAQYAKATYVNAKISLFGCGQAFTTFYAERRFDNIGAWKRCADYGLYWISNSEYVLNDSRLLNADLVHPNSASGVAMIANQVVNALYTGACDVSYKLVLNMVDSASLPAYPGVTVTPSSAGVIMSRVNGSVSINAAGGALHNVRCGVSSALTLNYGDAIDIRFNETLISGFHSSAIYTMSTRSHLVDLVTNKEYRCTIVPTVTTANRLQLLCYMIDPVPATDGVTSFGIMFEGAFND